MKPITNLMEQAVERAVAFIKERNFDIPITLIQEIQSSAEELHLDEIRIEIINKRVIDKMKELKLQPDQKKINDLLFCLDHFSCDQ